MRGPSSSHTAASFYLAALARSLLGDEPEAGEFMFDPNGSYGRVYREQGSDLAFAAGLLGWSITDDRFPQALAHASTRGLHVLFTLAPLPGEEHPNAVKIRLKGRKGGGIRLVGKSVGGGSVEITSLDGWPVLLTGTTHEVAVEVNPEAANEALHLLEEDGCTLGEVEVQSREKVRLLFSRRTAPLSPVSLARLERAEGFRRIWAGSPVCFVKRGSQLFSSAAEMTALAEERGVSCGELALEYESELLGRAQPEILDEMRHRFTIMRNSVHRGLGPDIPSMKLLRPSAGDIYRSESEGRIAVGGMHTRAAARAMAALHVNCGMGVVCAAPTAGSAGVLPAVATTLFEEKGLSEKQTSLALLAAGAIGVIVAERATFAAEVAGCQVEIGAAGAMAAAFVVESAGGTARQAADAAAISFQNTMGSVCDLVQGIVEIPCHTRNAAAASSAFVCADLILGGYRNPIPLDETIDAVYAVGRMLPRELKVTALGGLATTPTALGLGLGSDQDKSI